MKNLREKITYNEQDISNFEKIQFPEADKEIYLQINIKKLIIPDRFILTKTKAIFDDATNSLIYEFVDLSKNFDKILIFYNEKEIVKILATKYFDSDMSARTYWGILSSKIEEEYPGSAAPVYAGSNFEPIKIYEFINDKNNWLKERQVICKERGFYAIETCPQFKTKIYRDLKKIVILKSRLANQGIFDLSVEFEFVNYSILENKKKKSIKNELKL
jgi:hypothetical protein